MDTIFAPLFPVTTFMAKNVSPKDWGDYLRSDLVAALASLNVNNFSHYVNQSLLVSRKKKNRFKINFSIGLFRQTQDWKCGEELNRELQLLGRLQPFPALALSLFFCTLTSLTVESVPHRNSPQRNLHKKLSFPWRVPMSDNVYLKHTTLNVLIKVIDSQFIVKTFHIV